LHCDVGAMASAEDYYQSELCTLSTCYSQCDTTHVHNNDSCRELLISAPSLGVYYCQQLTPSVCPSVRVSVCHKVQIASFFCFSMLSSHFWPSVLHDPLYKTLDFGFRPHNAQNLLPKICTKSPISRLASFFCMADRPEMFGPTRGFSEMADSTEPCKMLWGRPLLPWQQNLG